MSDRKKRDSGLRWIGAIPKEWVVDKGKYLFRYLEKPVREDDGVITCFRDGEVTLRANRREEGFTESMKEIGYQGIDVGDLIVHGMDGFAGAIGISDSRGKASPVLNNLDTDYNKKYYMYLLRVMAMRGVFLALSTGIRVRTCDTNWGKLRELPYLVPSLSEQHRIADFLDSKCSQIDEISKKIQEEIDTLEEYKKSVITETVTKGLDPNVGMIPLKYVVTYNDETLPDNTPSENEFDYIDIGSVFYGKGIVHKERMAFKNAPSRARRIVKNKDTIVSTVRTYLKAVALIENLSFPTVASTGFIVLRPREEMIDSYYLSYVVQSSIFVDEVEARSTGVSYPAISSTEIVDIKIPVPAIEEQINISNYLSRKCGCIDKSIEAKQQQLSILEEYKKSLIYEYVTGKKEVTNVS